MRARFADDPQLQQHQRAPTPPADAWGSDEDDAAAPLSTPGAQPAQQQLRPALASQLLAQLHGGMPAAAGVRQQQLQQQAVPSLVAICVGVLGRHVTALVAELDGQLGWLPADVKASLLAVARRRGELTGALLAALADEAWTSLDVAGCRQLTGADLLAVAPRLPRLRALDVTGCERIAAGAWRQLAAAWPRLALVRLGGCSTCSEAALKALPRILPSISPAGDSRAGSRAGSGGGASAADDGPSSCWEDALASSDSDSERDQAASAAAAPSGQLKQLRALVWAGDVPDAALALVAQRCPRVLVNPAVRRADVMASARLPAGLDAAVPLDEPLMELVGPAALQDLATSQTQPLSQQQQQQQGGPPIAEKFRAAYVEQAARLRDKERRLWAAAQRRQLRSSHALRAMETWLDEPA